MGEVITDLSRIWVQYLSRTGTTYRVSIRTVYLDAFAPPYNYIQADESIPWFNARPAQLLITASDGVNVFRRRIPWSSAVVPVGYSFTADNLTWTPQSIRCERRTSNLSPGVPLS
jgi:hypothetical protein